VCMFCRQATADPEICGKKVEQLGLCAHQFCMILASELSEQPVKKPGLMSFRQVDVYRVLEGAVHKDCCVCRRSGATITCGEMGCTRSFHLPCASKGECITQY
ncbi:PHF7 protein, partial [Todus mexicanus]|nr:PHF7 protein [Todus mexicanus]